MKGIYILLSCTGMGGILGYIYAEALISAGMSASHYFAALRGVMVISSGLTGGIVCAFVMMLLSQGRAAIAKQEKANIVKMLKARYENLSRTNTPDNIQAMAEIGLLLDEVDNGFI